MAKRILLIAAVLIVAGFLYVGYTTYDGRRTGNGDVRSPDSSESRSKPSQQPSSETAPDVRVSSSSTVVDPPSNAAPDQNPKTTSESELTPPPGTRSIPTSTPPASDTISPNPPNGMVFAGTGHYQLYRQGNLTWRLNTDTGQSCILFATDEEWKKSRVLRAGCGRK